MLRELWHDTRGQPIGIARFFLSLLVGGILIMAVLTPVATPLLNSSMNATASEEANKGTMWLQEIIDYAPLTYLFIAFMGIILVGVFQRARVQ